MPFPTANSLRREKPAGSLLEGLPQGGHHRGPGIHLQRRPEFRGFDKLRLPGVLQRIGITYFFGALIYLGNDLKGRIGWVAALLLGYWAIMAWIPVPGIGAGVLTPEGNLAGYVDRLLLNGACAATISGQRGLFVHDSSRHYGGFWKLCRPLAERHRSGFEEGHGLAGAGLAAVLLGYAWNPWFPLNKNLWTSSFALAAADTAP